MAGKLGDLDLRNRQRGECPLGSNWETIGNSGCENARAKSAPKRLEEPPHPRVRISRHAKQSYGVAQRKRANEIENWR
jgi:hypothetical protein